MAFFTQAKRDGTIDKRLKMSDEELKREMILKVLNSNAFDRHKMQHKDAQLSTVAQEGGFSQIEKSSGKMHEDEPAIMYDSNTKNFVLGCSCGKEKFIFDIKKDTVESESTNIRMKEMDPYKKNDDRENGNSYGRNSGNNAGYNNSSQNYSSGNSYRNNPSSNYHSPR
jgi:hypothetical protein